MAVVRPRLGLTLLPANFYYLFKEMEKEIAEFVQEDPNTLNK